MQEVMFKLKIKYVEGLVRWLKEELILSSEESRVRTKFANLLWDYLNRLNPKKMEIIGKYANKDAEGNLITVINGEGKKMYDVPEEKMNEFNVEFNGFLEENLIIPVKENEELFKKAKQFILNSTYPFGVNPTDTGVIRIIRLELEDTYPIWCEALENLIF